MLEKTKTIYLSNKKKNYVEKKNVRVFHNNVKCNIKYYQWN